ncbi:MAG: helix-turn-helix transcriptional regulator [Clostridia bacterium]|nr:helix-turn-helix transcriptional regulator [Clostridia bacterium]MBQ2256203.1 helix-turn-helix transcriptional regulator [Clostridia bacterium]MBQ5792863.1 helix-turn-helix transcriptional regulator [Clostridia bacterium]
MKITLAENIKKMRTEKSLTQSDLAEALSVTPQSVSRWENGLAYPDTQLLPEIARYFGVTLDELMMGEQPSFAKLLQEYNEIQRKLQEHPGDFILMSELCGVLGEIAEKSDSPNWLGLYFHSLVNKKSRFYIETGETEVERARNIIRERLKTAERDERYALLRWVIEAEEEGKLNLWKGYVPASWRGHEFLWDDFLLSRYASRGDVKRWEHQRQIAVYRQVCRALRLLISCVPNVPMEQRTMPWRLPLQSVENCEKAMELLNTFSARADDVFLVYRVVIETDYAGALFAAGQKERGYRMLEECKQHSALMWEKVDQAAVLRGSVPALCEIEETYHYHFVMGVSNSGMVGNVFGVHDRAEFDSVREEERFRELISEMAHVHFNSYFWGRNVTIHEIPDFEQTFAPMIKVALDQLRMSKCNMKTQATVFCTVQGNTYFVIEPDAKQEQPKTLQLLRELDEKGERCITRCVSLWWEMGGEVDLPSYAVREAMVKLHPDNRKTSILVSVGKGFDVQELGGMM